MSSLFNLDATAMGGCLTTAQRVGIKNALYRLQIHERLDDVQFWGKINGSEADYFIAVATTLNTSIHKHFYWSVDNGVTFARFPVLDDFITRVAPLIPGLFTGNPALKSRDPSLPPLPLNDDGQPIDDADADPSPDDDAEAKPDPDAPPRPPPARKLSEEERLAWVVQAIDTDCALAPVGHALLTPTGAIQLDPAFPGLPLAQLPLLSSWAHWRAPVTSEAKARARKAQLSNCYEFLDGVVGEWGGDGEGEEWAVQVEAGGLGMSLRSLKWMGWEVRAEVGGSRGQWSQAYFGYGEANNDLPFML